MLDRSNVFEVSREGHRLLRLEAKAVGRKFRRFLERLVANGLVAQTFAYDEGFNERQLKTLAVYANHIASEQRADLPAGVATYKGVLFDECFGLVANHYQLEFDVDTASVAQLREAVELVVILADWMHAFVGNANLTALLDCPEYVYRNLPCSIVPDEKLWCVSGDDVRGGAGVLEWCYDEADAREILAAMQRFPERFTRLKAERWADAMSIPEEQVAEMA